MSLKNTSLGAEDESATDNQRSRRAVLGATGALIGGSVLGVGAASASNASPAEFWVESVSGVPDSVNCEDTVSMAVIIKNYSSFGDTQTVELQGGYSASTFVTHDSATLQLTGGEEGYVRLESDTLDQSGDWAYTVHTALDVYPSDNPVDVSSCSSGGWW